MKDQSLSWVMPFMRAGYGARGIVYTIVGGLAAWSAFRGGQAEGTQDALSTLRDGGFGTALLWVIAIGLLAYMVWRLLDAALDLEDYGTDGKGIASRIGLAATGLIHGAIGVSIALMAMGDRSGDGGGTQSFITRVMEWPGGRWIVGIIGVCVIGAGIHYAWKGLAEKYKEDIVNTETSRKLAPVLKAGFVAEGVVVGIIGALILSAAWTYDPSQAGGVGAAFSEIRSAPFGRILLIAVALGLVAFAIENFIEAVYRVVPRIADDSMQSIASAAESEARKASGKVEGAARRASS